MTFSVLEKVIAFVESSLSSNICYSYEKALKNPLLEGGYLLIDLQFYLPTRTVETYYGEAGAAADLIRCERKRPDILLHLGHWDTPHQMKSLRWLLNRNKEFDRLETSIDGKLWTPLHLAVSANFARVIVEHDYYQACAGNPDYDPTMALKMLSAKNSKGQTPRELSRQDISLDDAAYETRIERYYNRDQNHKDFGTQYGKKCRREGLSTYLGSWEESPLFVAPGGSSTTTSAIINPTLTEFQTFLAVQTQKYLAQTDLGELPAAAVMGNLAPRDLLNGWDQWGFTIREKKY